MTPEEIRSKHIREFMKLTPMERLNKSMTTAWQIRAMLTPEQRRIQDAMRNGGKRLAQQRLAARLEGTGSQPD